MMCERRGTEYAKECWFWIFLPRFRKPCTFWHLIDSVRQKVWNQKGAPLRWRWCPKNHTRKRGFVEGFSHENFSARRPMGNWDFLKPAKMKSIWPAFRLPGSILATLWLFSHFVCSINRRWNLSQGGLSNIFSPFQSQIASHVITTMSTETTEDHSHLKHSALVFNPFKRNEEVWRYLSYMLLHVNFLHLVFNLLVQLLLGVPLELVHGNLRVAVIYLAGVFAGQYIT